MKATPRATLVAGAAELGLALDEVQLDQLLGLLDLLAHWNQQFNLTAIREPIAMVEKHLLDSLTVQPWVIGPFVTDVGTGAGFPGLPLAIVNPELRFTLLDSTGKKVRFVEHAARALGLDHVTAICTRAENFRPQQRSATVVSRALGPVALFVAQAGHLCAKTGRLLAMKGRDPAAELLELPRGWRVASVERLKVPGLADARHLVILERGS
ncbi:MAG TPA: 16S rRNA (guanine(527)-N(7))-methyltransferase RsmG [Steroidobacteraceae bacterium]|nr:16S rRNA (guanine(527)-N(7))-methyltransferase RsmG [Steroidobacteraceae bacterium]